MRTHFWHRLQIVVGMVAFGVLFACAHGNFPTNFSEDPTIQAVQFNHFPLRAALIIPESVESTTATHHISCPLHPHSWDLTFPIGKAVASGAEKTFAQVFESVTRVADKSSAIGRFDVMIELTPPVLTMENDCLMGTLTMPIMLLALYLNPIFDIGGGPKILSQYELKGMLLDTSGQTVLGEAVYSSGEQKEVANWWSSVAQAESGRHTIGERVEKGLMDGLTSITRQLTKKPLFVEYAQRLQSQMQSRRVERGKEAPVTIITSDVDRIPSTASVQRKNRHAIVIGIEQYRGTLPKADFATSDAFIMGEYLTKVMGYASENVVVLLNENAARTDLEKYFEKWLPNRVEQGDSVFIYFSGHGAPNPKSGDAYLVPYDGDPAYIDTTGYPLKRLYNTLAKLPSKESVVLLDSCFSGAGGRSVIAKGVRPMVLSIENPILASGKTVVLAASSGEQVSSTYDHQGHGLFTYFFLKGIQGQADTNKDGVVDLGEVFAYLKPQVERVARREFNNEQTPQLIGSPELLSKGIKLIDRPKP